MAFEFLRKYGSQEKNRSSYSTDVEAHDCRSYCSNSDLFYSYTNPIAKQTLTDEEYKRQAAYYCS